MEIIENCEQNSEEWHNLRIGSIGGSTICDVVAKGRGNSPSITRTRRMYKMIGEIISGQKENDGFPQKYAERGHEFESAARDRYAHLNRIEVRQVAMVRFDEFRHFSPDGLINDDGYQEIKVCIPSVFIEFADTLTLATDERRQVQWGFRVMNRKWCDFIKYCPEFENSDVSPMIVTRIYPDPQEIEFLEAGAKAFISEMIAKLRKVRGL